jgi:hypothetical protein
MKLMNTKKNNDFWAVSAENLETAIELYEYKNGSLDLTDQTGAINTLYGYPKSSLLIAGLKGLADNGGTVQLSGVFASLKK